MDDEETQPPAETPSDAEIEAALWQEVEEAREAERAEELNEPVTDVEPTAEAPAQESGVEPTKPKAAEVVEIKRPSTITDRLRFAPRLRRRDETGELVALACTAAGDFSGLM